MALVFLQQDEEDEVASEVTSASPCIPERQFLRTGGQRCGTPGSISKSGRRGRDQLSKKSEIGGAEMEAFPVRGYGKLCVN